jgi:hypothetical protein
LPRIFGRCQVLVTEDCVRSSGGSSNERAGILFLAAQLEVLVPVDSIMHRVGGRGGAGEECLFCTFLLPNKLSEVNFSKSFLLVT